MKKRTFAKTQAATSLLGFGCMRFPIQKDGKINRPEAMKMLDYAYEKGVNYFDTAYPYHQKESEEVVGQWVLTKPRHTFYLATKSPVWLINSVEEFDRVLDEQLTKLNTGYIDFYLLHALSKERWEKVKAMNLLPHLKDVLQSGKVRRIGFSFHDELPVFEEILNSYDWDFCQIQLNYMDIQHQAGEAGYALAKAKNIPLVIMEPIKGGQLATVPSEIEEHFQQIHPDWSCASWALRWVADHDQVMTILSGMSTMDQVKDNIATFESYTPLNEDENKAIAHARNLFLARVQVPCTGCAYCMPCPFGVKIPDNFRLFNDAYIYQRKEDGKQAYAMLDLQAKASHCQKCGACKVHCPQAIDIPTVLSRVASEMEEEQ